MFRVCLVGALACCGGSRSEPDVLVSGSGSAVTGAPRAEREPGCALVPFEASTPVPEASGVAWLAVDGKPRLVVHSDSGNDGAYTIVDPDTGATVERGQLPVPRRADDLEGMTARGRVLVAVTSPGWIIEYERVAAGFRYVREPYPLGPIDAPATKTGMVCEARATNCGRNYEGICIAPAPAANGCVGFVASKTDGHLYCLVDRDGKLAVDRERAIAVAKPGVLGDCGFSESGALYVSSNLFQAGTVYRVDSWQDPATAKVGKLAAPMLGNPEAIAMHGDALYRMSDSGGSPSLMAKYRCP